MAVSGTSLRNTGKFYASGSTKVTLWVGVSVLALPLSMSLLWELTSTSSTAAVPDGVDAIPKE